MSSESWNLIGILVSVIGMIVGVAANYLFSDRKRHKKRLLYEIPESVLIDDKGAPVRGSRKWFDLRLRKSVVIGIKNDGTETIQPADYLRDITFDFGHGAVIESREVWSYPANVNPAVVVNGQRLLLKPMLWDPEDAILIRVAIRGMNGIREDFRISGTHVYEYGDRTPVMFKWRFMLPVSLAVSCLSLLVVGWAHLPLPLAALGPIGLLGLQAMRALWWRVSFDISGQLAIKRWKYVCTDVHKHLDGPTRIG